MDYIARGWWVFPCHSIKGGNCTCGKPDCGAAGKHPRTVRGFLDATTELATIRRWQQMFGHEVNWAIRTGVESGIAVVDVDPRSGGDKTVLSLDLPQTLTSLTGGRGHHYVYAVSEPTPSRKIGPGVDFKADGGYIIAPPSRHASGGSYSWRDFNAVIAPLPDHLSRAGANAVPVDWSEDREFLYPGYRNDGLWRRAQRMRFFGTDARTLAVAVHAMNRTMCKPPLPDDEVDKIVRSAVGVEPIGDARLDWAANLGTATTTFQSRAVGGGSYVFDEPDKIPAVWGSGDQVLWAEGEGFMLAGQQGVGKTTLIQQFLLHRIGARSGDLLGYPVSRSDGKVLYLAMDRPRQAARSMRRMVPESERDVLDERLVVWRGPLPVNPLSSPSALSDFMEQVCPECDLMLIDSLKDVAPGLSKDEIGAQVNLAIQEAIARGYDVGALHHGRKAGGDKERGRSIDDIYGSTWLTSGLGSVFLLEGEPGDPAVTMHHVKQPAEPVGPLHVRHDHATGTSTVASVVDLWRALCNAGVHGLTRQSAALIAFGDAGGASQKRVGRQLERWVADGAVLRRDGEMSATGRTPTVYFVVDFPGGDA